MDLVTMMVIIRTSEKRGSKKETSLSRQMAFGLMPIDIDPSLKNWGRFLCFEHFERNSYKISQLKKNGQIFHLE